MVEGSLKVIPLFLNCRVRFAGERFPHASGVSFYLVHIFILIRAHLAHAQKINKFFALGQKLEREGMINK